MASGPLGAGGGLGEKHRWVESKVYTRKALKSGSKSNPNSQRQSLTPQEHPKELPQSVEDASSVPQSTVVPMEDRSVPTPSENEASIRGIPGEASGTQFPVYGGCENGIRRAPLVSHRIENGEMHRVIDFSSAAWSVLEVRELRRKLTEELELVRGLIRKIEAREQQLVLPPPPAPSVAHVQNSQLHVAGDDVRPIVPFKRPTVNTDFVVGTVATTPKQRQLSVSVPSGHMDTNSVSDTLEKEKRTPKANPFYRSSEFITGKDRFPPSDSNKKSKVNGSKKGMNNMATVVDRLYAQAFKSCSALLTRLMKHKHGWVFNSPVDAEGLGLYDYHLIIKRPMDLGTVKTRLDSNWYKFPREFAEDVRLTFENAMTYNPKGQDVHVMAEQLSKIFEEKWPSIEAECTMSSYSMMHKKLPSQFLDTRKILERSDSTTHQILPEPMPKALSYTPHSTRPPAMKKPKAKDLNKRDMTFEEKQKLSVNLQNLPSEKLDVVVQIIKKRNSSLSQHDDEIEVDIDSVDTETLWELDRFVTNYRKSLSKHKRRAELALQAKQEAERNAQKLQNQSAVAGEVPVMVETDEKRAEHRSPVAEKAKGDNESLSSSSCSSSSDSGSSSSDSDSESSSS